MDADNLHAKYDALSERIGRLHQEHHDITVKLAKFYREEDTSQEREQELWRKFFDLKEETEKAKRELDEMQRSLKPRGIDSPEYKHVAEENAVLHKRNVDLARQMDRIDYQWWDEKLKRRNAQSQGYEMAKKHFQYMGIKDRIVFLITKKLPGEL